MSKGYDLQVSMSLPVATYMQNDLAAAQKFARDLKGKPASGTCQHGPVTGKVVHAELNRDSTAVVVLADIPVHGRDCQVNRISIR